MTPNKTKLLLFCIFCVFLGRLFQLQVIGYTEAAEFTRKKLTSIIIKHPRRGTIYDRNNKIIAQDVIIFNIELETKKDPEHIAMYKDINETFNPVLEESKILLKDLSFEEMTEFQLEYKDHKCYKIEKIRTRRYPFLHTAGPTIGYCNKLNRDEINNMIRERIVELTDGTFIENKISIYKFSDTLKGRSGIELFFDKHLSGEFGITILEKDTATGEEQTFDILEIRDGNDVVLTIDIELQKQVEEIASEYDKAIAINVMSVNGEILAMSSTPGYNPNDFVPPTDSGNIREYLNDSRLRPLRNKAIQGTYGPASVFKTLIALVALNEGVLSPGEEIECTGKFLKGVDGFRCWIYKQYGYTHGKIDLSRAMATSCNIFFMELAKRLDSEKLIEWVGKLGFNRKTGISLPHEKQGLIPNPDMHYHTKLFLALGHGKLTVTPLQVTSFMGFLANKGKTINPKITRQTESDNAIRNIKVSYLDYLINSMRQTVQASDGTAYNDYLSSIDFAGKTGSTETGKEMSHGWFAGFFPASAPEYIITVFAEYGGSGGGIPVAITEKICRRLNKNQPRPLIPTGNPTKERGQE